VRAAGRRASFAGALLYAAVAHAQCAPHAGSGAMKKGLIIIPAVLILGFVGFVWLTLHWSYSRRACRLRAEALPQGLGVQDLGR